MIFGEQERIDEVNFFEDCWVFFDDKRKETTAAAGAENATPVVELCRAPLNTRSPSASGRCEFENSAVFGEQKKKSNILMFVVNDA